MAKTKNTTLPKPPTREELIDELGALEAELDAAGVDAKQKRCKTLRDELRACAKDEAPEKPVMYQGVKYAVTLGPQENETEVDVEGAFAAIGKSKFLAACSITLKALDSLLGAAAAKYKTVARTGTRKVTTFARG